MKKSGPYHKYHFTDQDDRYILDNYMKVTNLEMAKTLKVGLTSLRNHMYQVLKIRRFTKWDVWTDHQNQYVIDHFRTQSDAEMCFVINQTIPREDGRPITREMMQKKREILNLVRTSEEVSALYKTDFLQKRMYTIDKNSASANMHDNWVATVLAGRNNPELRKLLMSDPDKYKDILDLKRLQLKLNKSLKSQSYDNSGN